MLLAACEQLGAGEGRIAVDLGCGEGTEALALLDRGWSVRSWPWTSSLPRSTCSGHGSLRPCAERITIVCGSFAEVSLPRAELVHAGFSLPFCPPRQFPVVWRRLCHALVPGGIFAGQLFGTHDSWADDPGMTFQDRRGVTSLL
jgi:hypothetical protein